MLRQVTHDVAQTELELNRHRASSEEVPIRGHGWSLCMVLGGGCGMNFGMKMIQPIQHR